MSEETPKNKAKAQEEFNDEFSALIQKVEAGVKDEVDATQLANIPGLKAPPKKKKPKTPVEKLLCGVQDFKEKGRSLGSRKIVISTPNATILMGLGFLLLTGGFAALKSWQRSAMPQRKNLAAKYTSESKIGDVFDAISKSGSTYQKGSAKKWALDKKAEESNNKYLSNPSLVSGFIGFGDEYWQALGTAGISIESESTSIASLSEVDDGSNTQVAVSKTGRKNVRTPALRQSRYPYLRRVMRVSKRKKKVLMCVR